MIAPTGSSRNLWSRRGKFGKGGTSQRRDYLACRPILGLIAGIVALTLSFSACAATEPTGTSDGTPSTTPQVDEAAPQDESATEEEPAAEEEPEMTSGQENALESAQSYIELGGFSKQGLIEQLSSSAGEGFTPAQARYATNKVY